MRLQITHETHYCYQPAVETAQHVAYMQPLNHAAQHLAAFSLQITPTPVHQHTVMDVYGNARCFFSLEASHDVLRVCACSEVHTQVSNTVQSTLQWELARERFLYQAGGHYDAATEFVFASPFAAPHPEFHDYAQSCFVPGRSLLQVVVELMERIHRDFTYESYSTEINTPALDALRQRRGVCQDFAHIMIACLRSWGLAARYVSGYMLTHALPGQVKLVGSDASHAWVSVYLPDLPEELRWIDLDPTNNRWGWHAPGEDYITVARGRDFGDVSPLRGVIYGGANHTLSVGVTVEAVGENTDTLAPVLSSQSQSQSQSQS